MNSLIQELCDAEVKRSKVKNEVCKILGLKPENIGVVIEKKELRILIDGQYGITTSQLNQLDEYMGDEATIYRLDSKWDTDLKIKYTIK